MDPKLLEILKKAKAVDERAKKFDSVDSKVLESNINSRAVSSVGMNEGMYKMETITQQPNNRPTPKLDVNSETYKQRVKESKLPPEIQKLMLEKPIEQPDPVGTFSIDEEIIKELNPGYGSQKIYESNKPSMKNVESPRAQTQEGFDQLEIRRMIAEEIARALPSIVEKYFDKKLIQENVNILKSLKVKRRTNNNQ